MNDSDIEVNQKLRPMSSLGAYLLKLKSHDSNVLFSGKWNSRWLNIESHYLRWYSSVHSKQPSGSIDLRHIISLKKMKDGGEEDKDTRIPATYDNSPYSFLIDSKDKVLVLKCNTNEERMKWIRQISMKADRAKGGDGTKMLPTERTTSTQLNSNNDTLMSVSLESQRSRLTQSSNKDSPEQSASMKSYDKHPQEKRGKGAGVLLTKAVVPIVPMTPEGSPTHALVGADKTFSFDNMKEEAVMATNANINSKKTSKMERALERKRMLLQRQESQSSDNKTKKDHRLLKHANSYKEMTLTPRSASHTDTNPNVGIDGNNKMASNENAGVESPTTDGAIEESKEKEKMDGREESKEHQDDNGTLLHSTESITEVISIEASVEVNQTINQVHEDTMRRIGGGSIAGRLGRPSSRGGGNEYTMNRVEYTDTTTSSLASAASTGTHYGDIIDTNSSLQAGVMGGFGGGSVQAPPEVSSISNRLKKNIQENPYLEKSFPAPPSINRFFDADANDNDDSFVDDQDTSFDLPQSPEEAKNIRIVRRNLGPNKAYNNKGGGMFKQPAGPAPALFKGIMGKGNETRQSAESNTFGVVDRTES